MEKFERPQGAIENYADLKVGDRLFHVYGIWPPFADHENIVTRAPDVFSKHPEYSAIHSVSADSIVFDVNRPDRDWSSMNFAADGNLMPGRSSNNNYWFRTEAEAQEAASFLRAQWEADPLLIAREIQQREDDLAFDDYDYHYEDEEV